MRIIPLRKNKKTSIYCLIKISWKRIVIPLRKCTTTFSDMRITMVSITLRKLTLKSEGFSHVLYDSFRRGKKYFHAQEEVDLKNKLKK